MPDGFVLSLLENLVYPILIVLGINYFVSKKIDQFKHRNAKELQVESYFRDISGSKLESNFEQWLDSLLDTSAFHAKMKNSNNTTKQLKKTFMYGSEETVKIASLVMQQIYQNNKNKVTNDSEDNWVLYMLVAHLLCSLKKDYTGYDVDPLTIVMFKITDYSDSEVAEKFHIGNKIAKEKMKNATIKKF